ncbi:CoA activase [candidate division KSB1 bacterium]|nr:MAG: CoA activase [candidate division KSB1 bacterium]
MVTAGIDLGAKTIKVIILDNGNILIRKIGLAGFESKKAAEDLFNKALSDTGIKKEEISEIVATGAGKEEVEFATKKVTEVTAGAKGAVFLFPSAKTVIDVGAEEGRSIRCDETGKVIDFAVNEKCAAGAGAFTEAMARALEVKLEEFGRISLKSTKTIPMNAQCAVFAESEVVSLLHAKTPKEDIARAVHDAIASRITSMARKVGFEKDIVLIGGVARNAGFIDSLKREIDMDILIPEEPEFVCALGAALIGKK